jgi:tRNA dimethylallyltransferase
VLSRDRTTAAERFAPVQVYRGFDIGSAKPTAQERQRVRHHLVDVADWHEPFDAQHYRRLALDALAASRVRGCRPIVCGGTGLYLRALRWGLVDAPGADAALRERLLAEEREQPGCLHQRLRRVDPQTAARTPPANVVHVLRALEIHALTGRPASEVRQEHGFRDEVVPMRVVALEWPRPVLRERIVACAERMLSAGLLHEVERLLASGVPPGARPMRSVGYREACAVVLGQAPAEGLAHRIVRSTWQYARRQCTWLRRERGVTWVRAQSLEQATASVLQAC